MNDEVLYTVFEVAQKLSYNQRRIRQMCQDNDSTAFKIPGGRKWLIPESQLDRWMNKQKAQANKEITEDLEASPDNITTPPPKSLERLIVVATDLLVNDLDCVAKNSDPASPYEYIWGDRGGGGIAVTKQEISVQLDTNEETASFKHGPTRMSHFKTHLEQEVKSEYPELSDNNYSTIWAEHPYELIDTLRILAERKTFRGTCPVCKAWI